MAVIYPVVSSCTLALLCTDIRRHQLNLCVAVYYIISDHNTKSQQYDLTTAIISAYVHIHSAAIQRWAGGG